MTTEFLTIITVESSSEAEVTSALEALLEAEPIKTPTPGTPGGQAGSSKSVVLKVSRSWEGVGAPSG